MSCGVEFFYSQMRAICKERWWQWNISASEIGASSWRDCGHWWLIGSTSNCKCRNGFKMGLASSRGCHRKRLCVTLSQLQMLFRHLWDKAEEGWEQAGSSARLLCVAFQIHCGRTSPWLGILSCPSVVLQCHIRRGFGNRHIFKLPVNSIPHVYSLWFAGWCCRRYLLDQKLPLKLPEVNGRTLQHSSTRLLQTELSLLFQRFGELSQARCISVNHQQTPCTATPEFSVQGVCRESRSASTAQSLWQQWFSKASTKCLFESWKDLEEKRFCCCLEM